MQYELDSYPDNRRHPANGEPRSTAKVWLEANQRDDLDAVADALHSTQSATMRWLLEYALEHRMREMGLERSASLAA